MSLLQDLAKKAKNAIIITNDDDTSSVDIDNLLEQQAAAAPRTKTASQIVQNAAGPNLQDIDVPVDSVPPTEGEKVDFAKIYQVAQLTTPAFSAEQFLGMLASMPASLPKDTKRQTIAVSLTALGASTGTSAEGLVADATSKITALHTYVENLKRHTEEFVAKSEQEIADLQAQIESKRESILYNKRMLESINQQCQAEGERLDDVIEFFQIDMPPVAQAPVPAVPENFTDAVHNRLQNIANNLPPSSAAKNAMKGQ